MTLRQYLFGKQSRPQRGSISRLSEFLEINPSKAVRLAWGIDKPDAETGRRIQDFITSRHPISARKTGPKNGKSNSFHKNLRATPQSDGRDVTRVK